LWRTVKIAPCGVRGVRCEYTKECAVRRIRTKDSAKKYTE